jgi:hypothetical protein
MRRALSPDAVPGAGLSATGQRRAERPPALIRHNMVNAGLGVNVNAVKVNTAVGASSVLRSITRPRLPDLVRQYRIGCWWLSIAEAELFLTGYLQTHAFMPGRVDSSVNKDSLSFLDGRGFVFNRADQFSHKMIVGQLRGFGKSYKMFVHGR